MKTDGPGFFSRVFHEFPYMISGGVWWLYDALITRPLRMFYFEGPIYRGQPPEEICYEITKTESKHWVASPENIVQCQLEMERRFRSWDRSALTFIHFALLSFIVIRLMCYCFCKRNDICHCQSGSAGNAKTITVDELREMLRNAQMVH